MPWHANRGIEADAMVRFLSDLGVPADRMLLEGRSHNTYENVQEVLDLLVDRDIDQVLLVNSALHMRRAQATFHAAGIRVIPAATDHEVLTGRELTPLDFFPDVKALMNSSIALKEYLGLWVYRWRGWTD